MTVKGGTSQACAACKYQRRKCSADCPLAPYFPPDQPKMFQNAHRLFGVSNILKILNPLSPSQKMEAMRSIIYQSNIRDKYRVHGCVGIIMHLQYQIQQAQLELEAVMSQLNLYRQQQQPQQLFQQQLTGISTYDNNSVVGGAYNTNTTILDSNSFVDSKENTLNALWIQQSYNQNNNIGHPYQIGGTMKGLYAIQEEHPQQQYDEMPILLDSTADRQSFIDCKEHYDESSSGSDESKDNNKQSVEHISVKELKNAAACFGLTNVN